MSTTISSSNASSLNERVQNLRAASVEYRTVCGELRQVHDRLLLLSVYQDGAGDQHSEAYLVSHGLWQERFGSTSHSYTSAAVEILLGRSALPPSRLLSTNAQPNGSLLAAIEAEEGRTPYVPCPEEDCDNCKLYPELLRDFKRLLKRRDELQVTIDRLIMELDGQPASIAALLPRAAYGPSLVGGGGKKGECPICRVDVSAGEEVVVLPKCGHWFCSVECIGGWLCDHSTCPTCRRDVGQGD